MAATIRLPRGDSLSPLEATFDGAAWTGAEETVFESLFDILTEMARLTLDLSPSNPAPIRSIAVYVADRLGGELLSADEEGAGDEEGTIY